VRVHVIVDAEGSIVGFVSAGVQRVTGMPQQDGPSEEMTEIEIRPVADPGQTVYEVELPSELEDLNGMELQSSLIGYEVNAEGAELVQRSP